MLPTVAVMSAVPLPTAVTTPFSTAATAALLVVHSTFAPSGTVRVRVIVLGVVLLYRAAVVWSRRIDSPVL